MIKELKISLRIVLVFILSLLLLVIIYLLVKHYLFAGNYVAVYLKTGDLYFGKLSYFPKLKLKEAVVLQATKDGQIQLSPLKTTFWNSKGYLILSRENIVWISPIKKDSPFLMQLKSTLSQPVNQNLPSQKPTDVNSK